MATTSDRTLIRGGVVLTLDPAIGDFDAADVLIEGDRIIAVEPSITADAQVIDAARMIVMPGFIDTHHHHYHEVLRNSEPDGTLEEYMRDVMFAAAPQFRPEDAYIGNLSAALRAIDSGTTTVTDTSGVSNSAEHSDALIKGLKDAGVRAVYAYSRGSGPNANSRRTCRASGPSTSARTTSSSPSRWTRSSTRTSGDSRDRRVCAPTSTRATGSGPDGPWTTR